MAIPQARPTIRDIGRETGFHYSTLSLALRDHPRIPDSTKQIIREAAQELGYRPDATLDEKSRCLSGMKKNSFQIGVVAVDLLVNNLTEISFQFPE